MTAAEFAQKITGARRGTNGQWSGKCPGHDDRRNSLSFADGRDGVVVNCHAGCSLERIAAAARVDVKALFYANGPGPAAPPRATIAATYDYHDERGALLYQVCRLEPKDFRMRRPDGRGGWTWTLGDVRRVVYRLPELAEAERVYLCEGEKDVDRLVSLGLRATTSPGGANAWRDEYAQQIKDVGVLQLVALPDHDHAGAGYVSVAATSCRRRQMAVKIVNLPGLPEHGDVSDWLDRGHTVEELAALVEAAPWREDVPAPAPGPADPILKAIGDSVWVVWPERASFEFARLHEASDSITAEVSVVSTLSGELSWARLNLASVQSRNGLARALEEREPAEDWLPMLERSCRLVAKHVRTGEPAMPLEPAPPTTEQWFVDGWIPRNQLTVIFGDGGVGKSYLALMLAVSGLLQHRLSARWPITPIRRAMLLDWESGHDEQRARLWRLTEGLGSAPVDGALLHRTMRRPLLDDLAAVRAEVARSEADLVIVDSLAPACGPEPETAGSVVPVLLGLRGLAVTVVILAHVSKVSADARAPARPFGSVFVQNLARSTIEVRRSDADSDAASRYVLSLYHRKANEGQRQRPAAFALDFDPRGPLTFSSASADSQGASLGFQILEVLKTGPKKPGQLAEQLDATAATIGRTLRRLANQDIVMNLTNNSGGRGKESQWVLIDRNAGRNPDISPDTSESIADREPGDEDVPF